MQNFNGDRDQTSITADHIELYLARGRAARSRAFYDALRSLRHWISRH